MRNAAFLFLLISYWASAQSDQDSPHLNFFERLDSVQTFKIEKGKSTFTPFFAPSYSPEMKVLFSAGGLYTFTLDKDKPLVSRSSVPFSVGYSTTGALQVNVRANIYGKNNKWISRATYWLKDMPDNYFGVGYLKARHTPKGDSTTAYHRSWNKFEASFSYQIFPKIYMGLNYDAYITTATEVNPLMAQDADFLLGGDEIQGRGFGFEFIYDTRDFAENAQSGLLFKLSNTYYTKALGSDFVYEVINIDYRQYIQIGRPRSTLTWQIKSRFTFDFIPWTEMSQLGTPFDLRGYLWGQYRDDEMVFGIVEYRRMFMRKTKNLKGNYNSPYGFVAWVGTGSISPKEEISIYWLPNVGLGFRFEIQPKMNLRLDYGFGLNSQAFYFSFNEAF